MSSLSEVLERADQFYRERADLSKVRLSLELLREALAQRDDYELLWRMGRAHFFLGQEAKKKSEAGEHHQQGTRACEQAIRLEPARVKGHFWLGVNLALLAQTKTFPFSGYYALRARRELRRAVQIDPRYHGAGPLRVLARLEHKLPAILGGSRRRARLSFEKAIALAPTNTVTRIYYAEMLREEGNTNNARQQLEAILSAPHDPDWSFEIERDQSLAREILSNTEARWKRG